MHTHLRIPLLCLEIAGLSLIKNLLSVGVINILEILSAAIVFKTMIQIIHHAEFSGTAVGTGIQLVIDDDTRTESCSNGQSYEVLHAGSLTEIIFTQHKTIGIIVYEYRHLVSFFQNRFQM